MASLIPGYEYDIFFSYNKLIKSLQKFGPYNDFLKKLRTWYEKFRHVANE